MKKILAQSLFASVVGLSIAGDIYYTLVKPNIDNTDASLETDTASAATTNTSSSETVTETTDTSGTTATATDIANADTTETTDTSSSETSSSAYTDGTYTSDTVATPHGQIQLQITITDGHLADITTLAYPNEERQSESINAQALPTYIEEAITAKSTDIQQISGAIETYDGFTESLQDALNQALS